MDMGFLSVFLKPLSTVAWGEHYRHKPLVNRLNLLSFKIAELAAHIPKKMASGFAAVKTVT